MPVFFEKEQHVLIQIESDDDWLAFYNICEGYVTQRDCDLIYTYLKPKPR